MKSNTAQWRTLWLILKNSFSKDVMNSHEKLDLQFTKQIWLESYKDARHWYGNETALVGHLYKISMFCVTACLMMKTFCNRDFAFYRKDSRCRKLTRHSHKQSGHWAGLDKTSRSVLADEGVCQIQASHSGACWSCTLSQIYNHSEWWESKENRSD